MSKKEIINLYEILGVSRNATLRDIKNAYLLKVTTIANDLKNPKPKYTLRDLRLVNKAYTTLSSPISRYIHDCELDGEEPCFEDNGEYYYQGAYSGNNDFTKNENECMIDWLQNIIRFLQSLIVKDEIADNVQQELVGALREIAKIIKIEEERMEQQNNQIKRNRL